MYDFPVWNPISEPIRFFFSVLDKDMNRIGILQNHLSVQWLERYCDTGEVKITARRTKENLELLAEGNHLICSISKTYARIAYVGHTQNAFGEVMEVRAYMAVNMLDDRIVMATERIRALKHEEDLYRIYDRNRRGLPFSYSPLSGLVNNYLECETTWDSVLEIFKRICSHNQWGFTVQFDLSNKEQRLKLYKGLDQFSPEEPYYLGRFGTDIGNIAEITITLDGMDYKNVAIVAGEGEGAKRVVEIVLGSFGVEDEKRELFVDARELQKKYQIATPTGNYDETGMPTYTYSDGEYSDSEYRAMLRAKGQAKLDEQLRKHVASAVVTQTNWAYSVDYQLGSVLLIWVSTLGCMLKARVVGVNLIEEESGCRIEPELGEVSVLEGGCI